MFKVHRVWMQSLKTLASIAVAALISSCNLFGGASTPTPAPIPKSIELSIQLNQLEGVRLVEGKLTVVTNALGKEAHLNVQAIPRGGILLNVAPLKHVDMLPAESRILEFPFTVDPQTVFSGVYVVQVVAFDASSSSALPYPLFSKFASTNVYVWVKGEDDVQLMTSINEYETLLKSNFPLTATHSRAVVKLDDQAQPSQGMLTLEVAANTDIGYHPRVTASVLGGILFDGTSTVSVDSSGHLASTDLGTFTAPATRIVRFPFRLDPNSIPGTYAILVKVNLSGKNSSDQIPVVIKLSSSSVRSDQKWLSLQPPSP